jgi:sodium/bile acid cotransporter 7
MGIPMANALFAGTTLGFVVLPMIVYHQMQFMTCANLARRYARGERQRVLDVGKGA